MSIRSLPSIVLQGLAFVLFTSAARATEETIKIMMPWDAHGTLHQIGVDKVLLLSEIEGVMYVEAASGALDTAFASCPSIEQIDTGSEESSASGYCTIVVSQDDVVYAEWNCEGTPGRCEGVFTLTGGTGRFDGVSGSSNLIVHSVIGAIARDLADGSSVETASGLAVLPELTYTIPSEE